MANSRFIFFVDIQDDLLYFKDLTEYPMTINEAERLRDDFGIAFAYTFGEWDTDTILVDLSNFYDMSNISSSTGGIVLFRVFIVANFNSDTIYSLGEIAYYSGSFYKSLSNFNGNDILTASWEALVEETAYADLYAAYTSQSFDNEYASLDLICEVPYTPYYKLVRTSDYGYTVRNNFEGIVVTTDMNLYDYENNLVENFSGSLILPEDGVYKVVIDCTVDGVVTQLVLILGNFYAFEVCSRKLIEVLTCEGSDCAKYALLRNKINEFSNIYFAMFMNINIEKLKFYGIQEDSDEKADYMQEVGLLVKKAKLLVTQCEACQ